MNNPDDLSAKEYFQAGVRGWKSGRGTENVMKPGIDRFAARIQARAAAKKDREFKARATSADRRLQRVDGAFDAMADRRARARGLA